MKKRILSLAAAFAVLFGLMVYMPEDSLFLRSGITAYAADVSAIYPDESTFEFIKGLERCNYTCYWDVSQWTIGFGNKCPYTHTSNGTGHQKGPHTITNSEAQKLFMEKITGYVNTLKSNCRGLSMNQNQFNALLSATYNHGNVIKCPLKYYLQGELTEAQAREQYYEWCINRGTSDEKGLRNRRKKEADLFFSGGGTVSPQSAPKWATIKINKTVFTPGEAVTFTMDSDCATGYTIGINNENGTHRLITEGVGKTYTNVFGCEDTYTAYVTAYNSLGYVDSNLVTFTVKKAPGAGQTIPDGDYYIYSRLRENYFLDLSGDKANKAGDKVQMWLGTPGYYDAWTVKYRGNGFYKISQRGTDLCLDVPEATAGRNVPLQVWTSNDCDAQQWSIAENGDNGYVLTARCSGRNADVLDMKVANETAVWQHEPHGENCQSFCFVPCDRNDRPLADGTYAIYNSDSDYFLDVVGDPGEFKNESNVGIYKGTLDKAELYNLNYQGNGWYTLREATSGLYVEVWNGDGAYLERGRNVSVYSKSDSRGQLWRIVKNSDGTYRLISKLSGLSLDLEGGKLANVQNVRQWSYNDSTAEKWRFVRVCKHSWGNWITTKAARLSADGSQKRTCSVCGMTETRSYKANDFFSFGVSETNVNINLPNNSKHSVTFSYINHDETISFYAKHSNNNISGTEWGNIDNGKGELIIKGKKNGTETIRIGVKGEESGKILAEKAITVNVSCNHKWGNWTVDKKATCTAEGQQSRKCSVCGQTETKTIAKRGHSYSYYKTVAATPSSEGYWLEKCDYCGATTKSHFYKYREVNISAVPVNAKPGETKTVDLYMDTVCGDIAAFAFKLKYDTNVMKLVDVDTSLPKYYNSNGFEFKMFNYSLDTQIISYTYLDENNLYSGCVIDSSKPAFRLTFEVSPDAKPGKYDLSLLGNINEDKVEFVCPSTDGKQPVPFYYSPINLADTVTVSCEHKYNDKVIAPTCTKKGYTEHVCPLCGDKYVDSYVEPTGHKWSDWKVTKEPTESVPGLRQRECSICHTTESQTLSAESKSDLIKHFDINGDGEITVADIVMAQKALTGKLNFVVFIDLNNDSKMNVFDLMYFKRKFFSGKL